MTAASRLVLAGSLLASGLTLGASAQDSGDWSRFRGPNGDGVAEGGSLPVEFGVDKNLVWRTPLPPGHSSPVLLGEKIFLTATEEEKLYTYCLRRESGEILWRKEAPRDRVSKLDGRNNDASPSPVADKDTVVVFFNDYGMLAYDHDGEERWRLPLGPFDNLYGMGASPVLVGNKVILACDQNRNSYLIAVDKSSGEELWKVDRPRATSGHCTPILYQPDEGGLQLILPGSFLLDAYEVETGERVWWVSGLCFEMKSVPVLHEGVIYINGYGSPLNQPGRQVVLPDFDEIIASNDKDESGDISRDEMPESRASGYFGFVDLDGNKKLDKSDWDYLQAVLASVNGMLAIKAGGKGDMTEENVNWTYHRSIPQLPSPLIYKDVLYMLHDNGGLLTTFEPASGEVIERGRIEGTNDGFYASPVAGDDKIYMVSLSGMVAVLAAGGSIETLAVNELDEPCYATPAIAGGRIYLRTELALYCFGLEGD
ncbi:MAG: outer membrane protein assembly factor BamB family protein [Planctomycetota bacterium]|jgi:outer membrane protein assembly factor BamB